MWFIIVLLTINTGVTSEKIITKLNFETLQSCQEYVVENYDWLNERVNKDDDQHKSTPNLYRCVIGLP